MTKTKNTYKENISNLHGNLVVSYDEGDRLGNVGDVYFDKRSCRIKGISLSSKFLEAEEKNFVKFKDIRKLGNSVVIISNKKALETIPAGLETSSLRSLKGIKIVTQDGEHLGEMTDANIIAENGIIQEIILWGKKKIRVDVEKDKISIGPDMIVVPAAYKTNITPHEKQSEDTLGNVVKSAGEVTRKLADSFSVAVHKVAGTTKPDSETDKNKRVDSSKKDSKKTSEAVGKPTAVTPKESPKKTSANKTAPAKKAAPVKKTTPVKKATPAKKAVPAAEKATSAKKAAPAAEKATPTEEK